MPWFALRSEHVEYEIAPGRRVSSFRAAIRAQIAGAPWLQPYCLVDTVATALGPSVRWIPVPTGPLPRFVNGQPTAPVPLNPLLTWWDPLAQVVVPCRLAEIVVPFSAPSPPRQSDPLTMLAKVLQSRVAPYNDQFILIGLDLLAANGGQLHLEGQPWGLAGPGLFFPP